MQTLTRRALGRATLARQHLLDRSTLSAAHMIGHLGGMQAQAPLSPYVGLWTRLSDFKHDELGELLLSRQAVRAVLMRATVHLVTAEDARRMRPVFDRLLEARFNGHFGREIEGLDRDAFRAAARKLAVERPHTRSEFGKALVEQFPGYDADILSYAAVYMTPLAQVTPRGVWGQHSASARLADMETWLEQSLEEPSTLDWLVLRYLGAFGPATAKDVQLWSGLTRLKEVLDRLDLVKFKTEDGATLYDLPGAPRPAEDVPAPARFLPEYDNLLLSHADRSRVMPEPRRVPLPPGHGSSQGTFLVDGWWRGTWKLDLGRGVLQISPFAPLTPAEEEELAAEGAGLITFAAPSVSEVEFV